MRTFLLIISAVLLIGGLLRIQHGISKRVAWLEDEYFAGPNQQRVTFTATGVFRRDVTVNAYPASLTERAELSILSGRLHEQFVEQGFTTVDGKKIR